MNSSTYTNYVKYLDSTLLTRMNELKTVYSKYTAGTGTYSSISDARILLKSSDGTQVAKTMVVYWSDSIDDIYTQLNGLSGLNSTDSAKVLTIINHIDEYKALNTQYSNSNYNLIHSKTVNIMKEFVYLKGYETYLKNGLGLDVF
jgi:hypothetical protein